MFVHGNLSLSFNLRLEPELEELLDVAPESSNFLGHERWDSPKLLFMSTLCSLNGLQYWKQDKLILYAIFVSPLFDVEKLTNFADDNFLFEWMKDFFWGLS